MKIDIFAISYRKNMVMYYVKERKRALCFLICRIIGQMRPSSRLDVRLRVLKRYPGVMQVLTVGGVATGNTGISGRCY